jgi:hypothetical protein
VEVAAVASRSVVLHLGDGNNSTGAVHIGNGTSSSGNVQILNGTRSTGTITLGSSTASISLGCPLTPNYTYSATGTGTGKIGQIIDGTFNNPGFPTSLPQTNGTITDLPIGVWVLTGSVGRGGGGGGYTAVALSTTSNSYTGVLAQDVMVTGGNNAINSITWVASNTAITTYYLLGDSNNLGLAWQSASFFFRAVRIA